MCLNRSLLEGERPNEEMSGRLAKDQRFWRFVAKRWPIIVIVSLLAAFPMIVTSSYYLSLMVFIGIYSMMTLGLSLLTGYAGQLSLGQSAFFGIGAYMSGILTTRCGLSGWLIFLVMAPLMSAIVAVLAGLPILRFSGHVLAVATLALAIIFYTIFVEWLPLTGGIPGLVDIPRLSIGSFVLQGDLHYYYVAWIMVLLLLLVSWNIVHSRVGRAVRSIHHFYGGSEQGAEMLGVNPTVFKLQMFVLAAVYATFAGSIYAHYITFINPSPFGFMVSMEVLVMLIVGGLRSLWGAIVGAGAIIVLRELLRSFMPMVMPRVAGEFEFLFYGALLVIVLLVVPEGLIGVPTLVQQIWKRGTVAVNDYAARLLRVARPRRKKI